jgi:hypothetical protein
MIGPKTEIGGTPGWLYNPMSGLPYGNGNEFFYFDGAEWVKPTNEIEVELECRPGIMKHLPALITRKFENRRGFLCASNLVHYTSIEITH